MITTKEARIIFLNQATSSLFHELAEDIGQIFSPCILFTGHPDTLYEHSRYVQINKGPSYDNKNKFSRLISWLGYFFSVMKQVYHSSKSSFLFLTSNPPFLGIIGVTFKIIRSQKYAILVYDVFPDTLIRLKVLNKRNPIVTIWRKVNRIFLENASCVFTIGDDMKRTLEQSFDPSKTQYGKIITIPNWADVNFIKPLPKSENAFARYFRQVGKTTIIYSGNFGVSHNIEIIIDVAVRFRYDTDIAFLLIGGGTQFRLIEKLIKVKSAENVILLPFQQKDTLAYSLTTGDIAIVSMANGTEGMMVPSKTYSYMAAGSALIILAGKENEVVRLVRTHDCGIHVRAGDVDAFERVIRYLVENPTILERYRNNARMAAEKYYSRNNTQEYIKVLKEIGV